MSEALANITEEKIQAFEHDFLQLEQVDCPVTHRFGPGVYIREVSLPAGACIIGHYHKHPHMSVMLKGKMSLINDDGTFTDMQAPLTLFCPPGRKIAMIHEDVVWQNIYSTDETDVETLEIALFTKSEVWENHQSTLKLFPKQYIEDVEDFKAAIAKFGFDEKTVRQISEDETDQVPMPWGAFKFATGSSDIEGKGVFATADIIEGEAIGPARMSGMRTPLGRYTNHAKYPNAEMVLLDNGDVCLMAIKHIKGSKGGDLGEEITIDYRQALKLTIDRKELCQQ
jgi:quercetin dioxygenase-like cupin family protein